MKNTELESLLNSCLNDAMCKKGRIQGIPNSNKIAEFVTNWLNDKNLNLPNVISRLDGLRRVEITKYKSTPNKETLEYRISDYGRFVEYGNIKCIIDDLKNGL